VGGQLHGAEDASNVRREIIRRKLPVGSINNCIMYEIKKIGINEKFKTISHRTIMEQLRIKADLFRKQGRLQDQDLEEIMSKIKADEEFKDGDENGKAKTASKDKQKRVLKAVKEGLLQVHGIAHNTK
jgi:hypothetical protein